MIPESTLSKLIAIGRSLEWDDPSLTSRLLEIKDDENINRLHWREWDSVTGTLSKDEIVSLLKGLVAAEEKLKWTGGSVSAIIWVFRELERRDTDLTTKIAEWILQHTSNPYVPFGTTNFGARSLDELQSYKAAWESRRAATGKAELKRQEEANVRRRQRQLDGEKRVQRQKKAAYERQTLLDEFQSLTPRQRLERIAFDTDHPIEFFPTDFADVGTEVLKSLSGPTRIQLLQRLRKVGRGPWMRLRLTLESVDNRVAGA
ncbi:MAG: hypothetical protein FJ115_16360 [Deltaproteobacteria bacterium]|nr:hypothetical protein [Deltaproteobacteria bacterium]MBM4325128.1 hypothetical protein [Deltaproteobacteria bacterium]